LRVLIFVILNLFQGVDEFDLTMILWYITNIILFICCSLFLLKAFKTEGKSQKYVYIGYGLFTFSFGFTILFFRLAWSCGGIFEGCYDFYIIAGYVSGTIGLIIIMFIFESYLLNTKKILSGITLIAFILVLVALFGFTTREVALNMLYVLLPFSVISLTISYIYFIVKSIGSSRKKAIGVFIGLCLFFIGYSLNTSLFMSIFGDIPSYLSPTIMSIGIVLFTLIQIFIK
jgi:hypothetical protein